MRKRHCKHAGATPEAGNNFKPVADNEMAEAMKALAAEVGRRSAQKRVEDSEVTRLKTVIRDLEHENKKLAKDLQEERMATKVIERLGSSPAASSPRPLRKSRLADLEKPELEKIYLE